MKEQLSKMDPKQAELLVLSQVRKHLGKSGELHKLGITVNIQVCRLPDKIGKLIAEEAPFITKESMANCISEKAQPLYFLRAQHELAVQNQVDSLAAIPAKPGNVALDDDPEFSATVYDTFIRENYLYPKGGYTKVELVDPRTDRKYVGECHFGINTVFDRKLALAKAFGKMYSKMLSDSTLGRKEGKKVIDALLA